MRLLLVDDDPDDLFLLREALLRHGLTGQVLTAGGSDEALATLRRLLDEGQPPCLIVADTKMPRMGGLELFRRVREDPRAAGVRMALMSSSDIGRAADEAKAAGVIFLRKPMIETEYDRFVGVLRELVAGPRPPGV